MNQKLLEQIVLHVFAGFGIVPSNFINLETTKSLKSKEFLLPSKLSFETSSTSIVQNKTWGCELHVENGLMTVLLGDCSLDSDEPEFALTFSVEGSPNYGMYLADGATVLGYSLDGENWMPANTSLQATFLAAMEYVRELGMKWKKSSETKITVLKSFISFVDSLNEEEEDEG